MSHGLNLASNKKTIGTHVIMMATHQHTFSEFGILLENPIVPHTFFNEFDPKEEGDNGVEEGPKVQNIPPVRNPTCLSKKSNSFSY